LLAFVSVAAGAQTGNRIIEPQPLPASRWQADVARMDDALRARILGFTNIGCVPFDFSP
jgi:hypothetical protein